MHKEKQKSIILNINKISKNSKKDMSKYLDKLNNSKDELSNTEFDVIFNLMNNFLNIDQYILTLINNQKLTVNDTIRKSSSYMKRALEQLLIHLINFNIDTYSALNIMRNQILQKINNFEKLIDKGGIYNV